MPFANCAPKSKYDLCGVNFSVRAQLGRFRVSERAQGTDLPQK